MPSLVWNLAPDQLTLFSRTPSVDALLVHNLANLQCVLLGLDSLADVDVVDTARVPDADVALAAEAMVEEGRKIERILGNNTYIKIPTVPEGLRAMQIFLPWAII